MNSRVKVSLNLGLAAVLALTACQKKGEADKSAANKSAATSAANSAEAGKAAESGKSASADSVGIRVVAVAVKTHPFEDWGVYSADLRGSQDAVLTAAMGGRVANIDEVGKAVKAGQGLCDIESAKYQAMLLQARSALELAKGELDRQKVNVEKGFVGKAVLDKAELDFQTARVSVLQSQRAFEDSRCQSPFNGVLVSRFIERYQTVAPGVPTVRIASVDRLEAVVSIPESEAREFKEGQLAQFTLMQDTAKVYTGRLTSIDRAVEAHNRTIMARIEIPNAGGLLRPGMVGRARILRKKYDQAVVVASNAVLRLQEGTMAMIARDGKALQVPVKLGPSSGDSVLVSSGLSAGDMLITVGGFQVSTGTKVVY